MKRRSKILLILALFIGAAWGASTLSSLYTSWLWFHNLAYQAMFWRMIRAELTAGILFGLVAALLVGINLWVARRITRQTLRLGPSPWEEQGFPVEVLLRSSTIYLAGILLVLLLAKIGAGQWQLWLRYIHSQSFGVADPIFGQDVGFYVFLLPFYRFVANFLLGGLIATGLAVVLIYLVGGGIRLQKRIEVLPRPLAHLSALGGLLLLLVAWIYRLKIYGLLYSQGNVAFGAGYVDVNVEIWAYWFLVVLFLGAAVLFFVNIRFRSARLPLIGSGILVGGAIIIGAVPSALVQKLVVEPSELAREAPYIQYNIQATRQAYGLDRIEEQPFEAAEDLTRADIEANPLTIRNVRIWDERPLVQTYQQVQEIRPYYVFPDVDVDRYTIDGIYRQVMLSARVQPLQIWPRLSQHATRRVHFCRPYRSGTRQRYAQIQRQVPILPAIPF